MQDLLIDRFVEHREATAEGEEERIRELEADIDDLLREKEEVEKWATAGSGSCHSDAQASPPVGSTFEPAQHAQAFDSISMTLSPSTASRACWLGLRHRAQARRRRRDRDGKVRRKAGLSCDRHCPAGSQIKKWPDDGKGLRMSFADVGSTSGWRIPTFWFKSQGIDPKTYFQYHEGSTHPANEIAVANGQSDLATDFDRNRTAMIENGAISPTATKIVWNSDDLPNDMRSPFALGSIRDRRKDSSDSDRGHGRPGQRSTAPAPPQ